MGSPCTCSCPCRQALVGEIHRKVRCALPRGIKIVPTEGVASAGLHKPSSIPSRDPRLHPDRPGPGGGAGRSQKSHASHVVGMGRGFDPFFLEVAPVCEMCDSGWPPSMVCVNTTAQRAPSAAGIRSFHSIQDGDEAGSSEG